MKTPQSIRFARRFSLVLLYALVLVTGTRAIAQQAADAEGLVPVSVAGVDRVLQRPGTDWAGYSRVLIAPVEVSFSKSWNPRDYGRFGLGSADIDRIRRELATIARDTFRKVLAEGGYAIAETPAEGVLQVRPDIVDLYVNAPDTMEPGRTLTYVLDAGQMTLALELRDSITGTLLARARDRKRGTDTGRVTLSNRVTNRIEAERALRGWAVQLRNALDAARSKG